MSEKMFNPEIINELENSRQQEQKTGRKKCFTKDTKLLMILENIKRYETFGDFVKNDIVVMHLANAEQQQLTNKMKEYIRNTRPRNLQSGSWTLLKKKEKYLHKNEKNQRNQINHFIQDFIGRLMTKKINSSKRNQNTNTKANAAKIADTSYASGNW